MSLQIRSLSYPLGPQITGIFSVAAMVSVVGVVSGQDYPSKPIRIVASDAGGTNDLVARLAAPRIAVGLGQPVVVENRRGSLTGEAVARAAPDGYTLLFAAGTFWLGPLLQKAPYDPVKDFSPIISATRAPDALVVTVSLPVKSVRELIALAKARPGELNYSAAGIGSGNHLQAELFKSMAGVNVLLVNYKGAVPAITAAITGETQMTFAKVGLMAPYAKAGKVRALAVTSLQPSTLAPELPTLAASGVPGYESVQMQGMFAPAGTYVVIVNKLNAEMARVLSSADVKEKLLSMGVEAIGSSPEEFANYIKSDIARTGKLIKNVGIKVE